MISIIKFYNIIIIMEIIIILLLLLLLLCTGLLIFSIILFKVQNTIGACTVLLQASAVM